MSSQLGPIEFCCDAPPYHIVQACTMIGIESPADVRWCHVSRHLDPEGGWPEMLKSPWKMLRREARAGDRNCNCGHPFPAVEKFQFTLRSRKELAYFLGQCERCRTVYWQDCPGPSTST
jgi:hypothetical protein